MAKPNANSMMDFISKDQKVYTFNTIQTESIHPNNYQPLKMKEGRMAIFKKFKPITAQQSAKRLK